eukprot:TRINITY_DN7263_c0_g1_i5.p1 TRINITY_DN7263_c0_g1~~TRINITY_DN7263_c0_g1_i5.p1  ORF type:complete len:293 (+),score=45.51 TRINITY_DN7263_c0_g1_i5:112-990(+)
MESTSKGPVAKGYFLPSPRMKSARTLGTTPALTKNMSVMEASPSLSRHVRNLTADLKKLFPASGKRSRNASNESCRSPKLQKSKVGSGNLNVASILLQNILSSGGGTHKTGKALTRDHNMQEKKQPKEEKTKEERQPLKDKTFLTSNREFCSATKTADRMMEHRPAISPSITPVLSPCRSHRKDLFSGREWKLEDFELGKLLGSGRFGQVFLARERASKFVVALKTLSKAELKRHKVEHQVRREIEIQSHLDHPNVLILEYAPGGELFREIQRAPGKRFDEATASQQRCDPS